VTIQCGRPDADWLSMTTDSQALSQSLQVLSKDPALSRIAADGSLELLYQPEVALGSNELVAMEALLRWHHGDLGVLAPAAFLGAAENAGYSRAIADWVLATGAAEVTRWRSLPRRSSSVSGQLWLNVGADQLQSDDFLDRITFELAAYDLPDGLLGMEVSQDVVRELGGALPAIFGGLRRAGIALGVDHVTEWTPALAQLHLEAVKISHELIKDIDRSIDTTQVRSIIDAAHAHGMRAVAEGVETWDEAIVLKGMGCDRAYGWLFSSAQRADKARWLMTQGTGWRGNVVSSAPLPLPRRS
jgi:EAL domain-containing protein (putative c-di-GMP-specific phosphodiesterase class I)